MREPRQVAQSAVLAVGALGLLLTTISCAARGAVPAAGTAEGFSVQAQAADRQIQVEKAWAAAVNDGVISAVRFAPDGEILAGGNYHGDIRLWNAADGSLRQTLRTGAGVISGLSFSPDGKLLAAVTYDGAVSVWNAATGGLEARLKGHTQKGRGIAFSPDGEALATVGEEVFGPGELLLWNAKTGELRKKIEDLPHGAAAVDWASDEVLAVGNRTGVELRNARTGEIVGRRPGGPVGTIAYTPHGELVTAPPSSFAGTQAMSLAPDGRLVARGTGYEARGRVWLVERKTGETLRVLNDPRYAVQSLDFSSDGRLLAASDGLSDRGEVHVWRLGGE